MKRRYDFLTEQIKRQNERVMAVHAARVVRDQSIDVSYRARHIDYAEYKKRKADSRTEMFRQEKIACLDFEIAMRQFDIQMYTKHPETFEAPEE